MKTIIKNKKSYDAIRKIDFGDKVVIITFGTDWCDSCKKLEKEIELIDNILYYNLDISNEEFIDLVEEKEVFKIPYTEIIYKNKSISFTGLKSKDNILTKIKILISSE